MYHRGMRIKVKNPARNRKMSPNRIVGDRFEKFKEKNLEDLPCSEKAEPVEHRQLNTGNTENVNLHESRKGDGSESNTDWTEKFRIKPCSVLIEHLDIKNAVELLDITLDEGEQMDIEINWKPE